MNLKIKNFIENILKGLVFVFFVLPYLLIFVFSAIVAFVALVLWELWTRVTDSKLVKKAFVRVFSGIVETSGEWKID